MPAGDIGNLHTTKHTGDFLDTRVCIERINTAADAIALKMLGHLPLPFGAGRYLRQMGHTQYLSLTPEFVQ